MRLLKIALLLVALCLMIVWKPANVGAQCKPGPDPFTGLFVACASAAVGSVGAAGATGATGPTGPTGAQGPQCDRVTVAVSGANWSVTLNGSATTTAITAASNTQTLTIETLPAHSIIYGSRVYETVKYAGTSLSTLTVSGGATTTTDYFPAKSLVAAACSTPGTLAATCVQWNPLGGYSITDDSHSFTLTMIATGTANLAALTAGSVDVSLCRGVVQ